MFVNTYAMDFFLYRAGSVLSGCAALAGMGSFYSQLFRLNGHTA